ncbi:MAG TPA: hypothetical protein VGG11_22835 [Xanthobacteraceae bacterium]|jgi:hypothetical protein
MMLYAEDQSHKLRAAAFNARRARVVGMRKAAADMGALANGEPQPSDFMMVHDPVVSPDLRNAIVDARKRMWMMLPKDRLAYREAISPLADAIQDLIDTHGFKYTPLMRLISPRSMPNPLSDLVIENRQIEAKLVKFEGSTHACDLNYLVDPRVPASLRRRLIEAKRALDATPRERRSAMAKVIGFDLLRAVDRLQDAIGANGVAALRRVLGSD